MDKYKIIRDTREKKGYYFNSYQACAGMVDRKLDTGDYSIEGLEDKICIERKASISELALNLGQGKKAFMNEIGRMKDHDHKFLVLEFELEDLLKFPDDTNIPQSKRKTVKISGKYILKCLMEFQIHDGVNVMFCGNKQNAFFMVSSLLKRLNEMYTVGRTR